MARYGDTRVTAAGESLHRDHRAAAGTQDRLSGGNRLPDGIHRSGAARASGGATREECVWPVSAAHSGRGRRSVNVMQTAIPGVLVIEPDVRADDRGFFVEVWHEQRYRSAGIELPFVQDN